ncbi:hypothetical protein EDD15DRAFT_2368291 [Pisolithus albus]|nr:hypothetical protein EDD15DRAFT_2368291 [Pisolithus albus]
MSPPSINPALTQASQAASEDDCRSILANGILDLPKRKKPKLTIMELELDKAKYELDGRKLMCHLDPFGSPTTAISVGLRVDSGRESDLDMYYSSYRSRRESGLEDELVKIEASELTDICSWITTGMSNQRSTDLGSIKHVGLTYMLHAGEAFDPPIGKGEDKMTRRFNHPQIACLLCPRKKLDSFDEDHEIIIAALQEGLIKTSAWNWPTAFYAEGIYNPENKLKGLFCSLPAFWFYTHLFIGPSAAVTNTIISHSSKLSKNCAWGLTEVTLYIIAYVHVVMYFTLSTAPRWCTVIGQMGLSELLWLIIEMFDDKDDWTHETLGWWNA